MFKSIKRLLIAATVIVAVSAPATAFAVIRDTAGGSAEIRLAHPSVLASAPDATASASQGFQWGDAGVGAAGVVVLVGAGAGVASVMRHRRAHRPVTG